jgi:hypothetical protein
MLTSGPRWILLLALCFLTRDSIPPLAAQSNQIPPRTITANLDDVTGPIDRFFDLSVGSDYPGTLIRDDSHRQSGSCGVLVLRCCLERS